MAQDLSLAQLLRNDRLAPPVRHREIGGKIRSPAAIPGPKAPFDIDRSDEKVFPEGSDRGIGGKVDQRPGGRREVECGEAFCVGAPAPLLADGFVEPLRRRHEARRQDCNLLALFECDAARGQAIEQVRRRFAVLVEQQDVAEPFA